MRGEQCRTFILKQGADLYCNNTCKAPLIRMNSSLRFLLCGGLLAEMLYLY